jgi:hypothetical protein
VGVWAGALTVSCGVAVGLGACVGLGVGFAVVAGFGVAVGEDFLVVRGVCVGEAKVTGLRLEFASAAYTTAASATATTIATTETGRWPPLGLGGLADDAGALPGSGVVGVGG